MKLIGSSGPANGGVWMEIFRRIYYNCGVTWSDLWKFLEECEWNVKKYLVIEISRY